MNQMATIISSSTDDASNNGATRTHGVEASCHLPEAAHVPKNEMQPSTAIDVELGKDVVPVSKPPASTVPARLPGLDLFRGFIMVVMSWDHVRDFLAKDGMPMSEYWSGPFPDYGNNALFFAQRAIPHICAPGFFLHHGHRHDNVYHV